MENQESSIESVEKEKLLWEFKYFKERFSHASNIVSQYNNKKRKSEELKYLVNAYCLDLIKFFVPIITSQWWDFEEEWTNDYLIRELYLKNYDKIIEYVWEIAINYFVPKLVSLWILNSKNADIIKKQKTSIIKTRYLLKYLENNDNKEEINKRLLKINSDLIKTKILKILEENQEMEVYNPLKFQELLLEISRLCRSIYRISEDSSNLNINFELIEISVK